VMRILPHIIKEPKWIIGHTLRTINFRVKYLVQKLAWYVLYWSKSWDHPTSSETGYFKKSVTVSIFLNTYSN